MAALPTIKQLNAPQPVDVETGTNGVPLKIRLNPLEAHDLRKNRQPRRREDRKQFRSIRSDGQWMNVITTEDCWKINDEWWRGEEFEIERLYFDVVVESNQRLTVFHDLVDDKWFRQAE